MLLMKPFSVPALTLLQRAGVARRVARGCSEAASGSISSKVFAWGAQLGSALE
jgi:hypothetical protein